MVCSWQFPLVSGLLQMTVEEEEEEEECEERKKGGVFSFHVFFFFPLWLEETTAFPLVMCLDLSRLVAANLVVWWKWECRLINLRGFNFLLKRRFCLISAKIHSTKNFLWHFFLPCIFA